MKTSITAPRRLARTGLVIASAVILAGPSAWAAPDSPPSLGLPIDCVPGKTCWIVNYVDDDPGPGRLDYRCGWLTYDGHKGTDFGIVDIAAMRAGVPVLATAPGTVVGIRDGMADRAISSPADIASLSGRDCGNGVTIAHADGWSTEYCHLRLGSVAVKYGQVVQRGQILGLVGLSGRTEFPHVHLAVRHNAEVVDPFVGLEGSPRCGPGNAPLWDAATLERLSYRSALPYTAGFATALPTKEEIRNGALSAGTVLGPTATLISWVDTFWPRKGDEILFSILHPDGKTRRSHAISVKKDMPREFYFVRLTAKSGFLAAGTYEAEIHYLRASGPAGREEVKLVRRITLL